MRREITERAFQLALKVANLRRDRSYRAQVEHEVLRQLIRSSMSIGPNLEEATGAQSKADFIAKASIAKKESFETQYWLRLSVEAGILNRPDGEALHAEAMSIGQVVSAIVRGAKASDSRRPVGDGDE